MSQNYENVVRDWYNRLRPEFLRKLTAKYSGLTLADAENIYQDAFLAVYDNIQKGSVREDTNWSSYINTIGMNLASKAWRKIGKTDSIGGEEDDEEVSPLMVRKSDDLLKSLPVDDEELPLFRDPEATQLLGEELAHVPEPCNQIIVLYYYERISMKEIAVRVGYKNATTAKSKKAQCMKDLIKRVHVSFKRHGLLN